VERIGQLGQAAIAARGGHIELGGSLHAEVLMRPFGIELVNEGIEAVLLLQAVPDLRPADEGLLEPRFFVSHPGCFSNSVTFRCVHAAALAGELQGARHPRAANPRRLSLGAFGAAA
jgi:hypothetical protein